MHENAGWRKDLKTGEKMYMMRSKEMAAVLLLGIPMIASCETMPEPSNKAFLNLASEALKEPPPEQDCPEELTLTDFPKILLIQIDSPLSHISQGDSYGTDLKIAHAIHKANAGKVETFIKACEKGYESREKAYERRQEIRQDHLSDEEHAKPKKKFGLF